MIYKQINSALLILSIVICFVLLLYQIICNRKTKTDRWFILFNVSIIIMIIGDIIQTSYSGVYGLTSKVLQTIFSIMIYFPASAMLLMSLYFWVLSFVESKRTVSNYYKYVPIVLTTISIILDLFLPLTKLCYIDNDNFYKRGDYFFILMIFPYALYIFTFILMVIFRKTFTKKEFLFLFSFCLLPISGQIIQLINSTFLIQNVVVNVGMVALTVFIQNQRVVDSEIKMKELIQDENKKLELLQKQQSKLNDQLIEVLCRTVEAKDVYTRGHSMRVAEYAREIMYRLGGDEKAQQEVYYIGILHDVGKIRVNDAIINKKGKLTDEEYEQIKLHTISGYQILKDVELIPNLAIGARWHHERYDGTGYPNGLSGENIPLIARIISVADAYDAMTSNRSYHSAMSQEYVRDQIVKGMGTQFDPKIAKIMLDMIDDDVAYDMKQVNYNNIISIIMIDDDPFMHTMVEKALGQENYVFTFASNGHDGIELLKENKYDLCLLDKEMPDMNGFEVLEWIHKNVRKLKVILLTGDKDISTIKKSEKFGAVDYISKPIKTSILKESISSILKR